MFGRGITLFRLFGFEVKIDASWLIIAALITWSLASSVFPAYFSGLTSATYWIMGIIGALALFLSVVVHEFSHSLVARHFGLSMKGITLFLFGGVAEMADEPPSARAEFGLALAGPAASVAIAGVLYVVTYLGSRAGS
jgi:Zn-dependent protease